MCCLDQLNPPPITQADYLSRNLQLEAGKALLGCRFSIEPVLNHAKQTFLTL